MCRRIECSKCGKPSYAGCGAHVEQVLRDVPREDRCRCNEEKAAAKKPAPGEPDNRSWLEKLFAS